MGAYMNSFMYGCNLLFHHEGLLYFRFWWRVIGLESKNVTFYDININCGVLRIHAFLPEFSFQKPHSLIFIGQQPLNPGLVFLTDQKLLLAAYFLGRFDDVLLAPSHISACA